MIIGFSQNLSVASVDQHTIWLRHGSNTLVPLPLAEAPQAQPGDTLEVFIFNDSDASPLASTRQPHARLGECANLPVVSVGDAGAFLDWGLAKNLLLPYAQQRRPLKAGEHECVLVYLDNSGRLAATSRLDQHLPDQWPEFQPWQQVELLVYERTDLGFKAVINNCAIGLLYQNEIFQRVRIGDRLAGYIKRPRADKRIDLALQPPSRDLHDELADRILAHLRANNGTSTITDKSTPEEIQACFQVSKKNFKRALGSLYRERLVVLEPGKVKLAQTSE